MALEIRLPIGFCAIHFKPDFNFGSVSPTEKMNINISNSSTQTTVTVTKKSSMWIKLLGGFCTKCHRTFHATSLKDLWKLYK